MPLSLWTGETRADRPEILIDDFERPEYPSCKAKAEALAQGPAEDTLPNQMPLSGYQGRGVVNCYFGGDGAFGLLAIEATPEVLLRHPNDSSVTFHLGAGRSKNPEGRLLRRQTSSSRSKIPRGASPSARFTLPLYAEALNLLLDERRKRYLYWILASLGSP